MLPLGMCKHVLNAQVSVRFPCCFKFFDCIDCHDDTSGHPAKASHDVVFQCKKCDRCFRKDLRCARRRVRGGPCPAVTPLRPPPPTRHFEAADECCPYCGNVYVLEADTPAARHAAEQEAERAAERAAAAAGGGPTE